MLWYKEYWWQTIKYMQPVMIVKEEVQRAIEVMSNFTIKNTMICFYVLVDNLLSQQ